MQRFDMVVIGGGSTGIAAAYRVARAGRRVAVIDKGPMGGLCSLAGCNPKKVLVRASEVLQTVRDAAVHGVSAGELSVDWETVWKRKHSFTDPVPESTDKSLAAAGIARIHGVARFIDAETIAVGDGTFQADAFVIATGSHPRNLDFHGAAALKTSNDALELKEPPKRMSIIGSGVVAFEFSHVFARLGTKITMLMRDHGGLSGFDDDFSRIALEFARDHLGITFVPNADFTSIEWNDAGFVLNAAGRVAAIEELDLHNANVQASERGVIVDDFLRSKTNRRVFAGGDAHGVRHLSPVASYEGRIIARNFLEGDVKPVDYSTIPQCIYTTPPMASVGLTKKAAEEKGHEVRVYAADMSTWLVYSIAAEPIACARVIAEKKSGKVLGAQLFGASAPENIHLFALAIQCGLTTDHLAEMVYAYPTFASTFQSLLTGSKETA